VKALDKFLEFQVDRITADRPIPIDLHALSRDIGLVVEEREMIPEAVMQPVDGRFHVYLQSNFKEFAGTGIRRRFSLAHEIGHTLFYEQREGELKPRKDSPRGEQLEFACHRAASMILVPNKVLKEEMRQKGVNSGDDIIALARKFEVSIEVMSRRLHELRAFENNWAPVLVRDSNGTLLIEYAAYPHWLIPHILAPELGVPFSDWFRGSEQATGALRRRVNGGSLEAVRKSVTSSLSIFELHLHN
jgi:hypothetical protein